MGGCSRSHEAGARRDQTHVYRHGTASGDHQPRTRRTQQRSGRLSGRSHSPSRGRASARRKKDPTLISDLLECVAPEIAGNPCSDEKWVRSRLRGIAQKLDGRACPTTIGRLLRDQKIGLRGHRKERHTGKQYVRRDEQFRHIAGLRADFRASGDPRISVDTKKKELVGEFRNAGRTWCQEAPKANDHDFRSDAEALAVPYGIYDPERNAGHVCVGTSKDVPDFAVDAVEDWWKHNQPHYPDPKRLMIEADSGGSNSAKSRQYKKRLQEFADRTGL
ncbi:MAG: ISAzo13 family transposase, partial [Planctomycetaceae bacterium]|nr:ISAzo13 family transposase [Planctomycetaceae bacterium]